MDKNWKLQRYSRKDYSELVEFPVEIVGRDGVVRRYSFEDSIRLYQRRITFAPIRYQDSELVEAEVGHCRSRIDQLRRSFFHRHGWGTPDGEPGAGEAFGLLAGELAAFLCRVLRCDGRPDVRFERVGDDAVSSTWFVRLDGVEGGLLLYAYRFDGVEVEQTRERFFTTLKSLERAVDDPTDGERLFAFHHTADCGFILSCRGTQADELASWRVPDDELADEPTPLQLAIDLVHRGKYRQALERCRALVDEQPYHRRAYAVGANLANHLDDPTTAEELGLIGSRYFEEDAELRFQVGLARARQGRTDEALEALQGALERDPDLKVARFLLVLIRVESGRFLAALRAAGSRRDPSSDDRRLDATLVQVRHWLWWRCLTVGAGLACVATGALAVAFHSLAGLLPVGIGLLMSWTASWVFRRNIDRTVARHQVDDPHQGLRRIQRRSRPTVPGPT